MVEEVLRELAQKQVKKELKPVIKEICLVDRAKEDLVICLI